MNYLTRFVFVLFFLSAGAVMAQELAQLSSVSSDTTLPLNHRWWHCDVLDQGLLGISSQKTYDDLIGDQPRQTIVVAVIDGGTDTEHEDLKDNVWVNPNEVPHNGIDDDANGYVDDVHGWSFISGPGGEVNYDTMEYIRALGKMRQEVIDGTRSVSDKELKVFEKRLKKQTKMWTARKEINFGWLLELSAIEKALGQKSITAEALESYSPTNKTQSIIREGFLVLLRDSVPYVDIVARIQADYDEADRYLKYNLNPAFDSRKMVGDTYLDYSQRSYGDNRVIGPGAEHGTHVAGIIAAVRGNGIGMDGIADNAKIMVLRVVPDGDERDKDVANALYYAVDNGAKVINMSFGKGVGENQAYVDRAIAYAMTKDVLIVHAAGNESQNNDVSPHFPNAFYDSLSARFPHWIEVGASSYTVPVAAEFSNYGKNSVDLFAPGVDIYSLNPHHTYEYSGGTSMAAPVVAGIAAVVRGQFPSLTAPQVRDLLMKTALIHDFNTTLPGNPKKKAAFTQLSISGGIVNMYRAVHAAQASEGKR